MGVKSEFTDFGTEIAEVIEKLKKSWKKNAGFRSYYIIAFFNKGMATIIYVFVKDRREGDSHSLFSVSNTYLFKWPFLSRIFPGKTATETYFLTLMINSSPCIVWLFRGLSIYMLSF